jgi:hypothetical protein
VVEQFDAAKIRLIELLNDRGYVDTDPQPQEVVWERMNLPIARGLRGLIYVLRDLSQVDPSDLSALFAGDGRLRIGFAEIDPAPGGDPSEHDVDAAVRQCFVNPYYAFNRSIGTSLICIQGEWSNVTDARIKSHMAAAATAGRVESPYTPLYARAARAPRPWGVTALFTEHTGAHRALEIDWTFELDIEPAAVRHAPPSFGVATMVSDRSVPASLVAEPLTPAAIVVEPACAVDVVAPNHPEPESSPAANATPSFSSLWEFAIAVNRSDHAALALASNGSDGGIAIDPAELRKLVTTVWFRSVFHRLSDDWRSRLFEVLTQQLPIRNCIVKIGRHPLALRDVPYSRLGEVAARDDIPEALRADIHLLLAVGRLWGEDTVQRCKFTGEPQVVPRLGFGSVLGVFR